jgi:hypothetical protein
MIGAHVDGHNGSVVLLDGIQVVHPFDLNFHYVEQEEFIPGLPFVLKGTSFTYYF